MNIPLMNPVAQYRALQSEIDAAIRQVMDSGRYVMGPNVSAFEQEIAEYLGTEHAVGVASGTDALVLTLRALGIGRGDEVIVPTYTFFATAEAVLLVGATPILVDIEPDTYCLNMQEVARCVTKNTKAVIPVHLYGHPAPLTPLNDIAREHGLKVIEDNAQALGAKYRERRTGGLGDVGCLSFFPSKNLGACGDAGMVVTNDSSVAERIRMLRSHGWQKKYYPELIGCNSRLDELQAAILRVKLKHLDGANERRRALATWYSEKLSAIDIGIPTEAQDCMHVYHLYTIRVKNRDRTQEQLKTAGIASAVYYPQPVHLTKPLRPYGYSVGNFPIAEQACRETLAIPLFPELTTEQAQKVVDVLKHI